MTKFVPTIKIITKKRDATQESTWFSRAVGMYFILEDQDFKNNQRFVPNIGNIEKEMGFFTYLSGQTRPFLKALKISAILLKYLSHF